MANVNISKEEIQKQIQILAKIRPPEDQPTEKQVEEMLLRMKKRWGLA